MMWHLMMWRFVCESFKDLGDKNTQDNSWQCPINDHIYIPHSRDDSPFIL